MTNLKIVVLFAVPSLLLAQKGSTAPSISSVSVSGGAINITGAVSYYDNYAISTDVSRDLYLLRNETESPR